MKKVHPYNYPEKIQDFLDNLKSRDYCNVNVDNLTDEILDTLCFVPFAGIHILKGTKIYRARINETKDGFVKVFNNIKDFGARDSAEVLTYGRANRPNQSVFYGSFDGQTAAREVTQWHLDIEGALVKSKIDRSVYNDEQMFMSISTWELCEDMLAYECYDTENSRTSELDSLGVLERLREEFEFEPENFKISEKLISDFFNNEFLKSEINSQYDYVLSTAIANLIYSLNNPKNKPKKKFMLIFKSIANDLDGQNIAISESQFDCIKLTEVLFLTCVNQKNKLNSKSKVGYMVHFLGKPSENNKTIVWEKQ